jgi:uncharacterized metal-binding protein
MPDLPKRKVGIVACSGEERPEGTITRLAALKVLEQLRPGDTVTICLPLFLAGGEGDRAFARFYPTIAVDGCDQRCAARATEKYSAKPAASIVITDLISERGLDKPEGSRRLNAAGQQATDLTAERLADQVDELLDKRWSRRAGTFAEADVVPTEATESVVATCACGSGIPVQTVAVEGQMVTLVGLPLILAQFHDSGKPISEGTTRELLETVKIYNPVPAGEEEAYTAALAREYTEFCQRKEPTA